MNLAVESMPPQHGTRPALETAGLVAGYRRGRQPLPVVDAGRLHAVAGELTAVIGPNGGGKSTLLRTLVGAQPPLAGEVLLDGTSLHHLDRLDRARRIAVVLTDRIDPGLLTVADIVLLGRYPHTDWRGQATVEDELVAHEAAARLGVEGLWGSAFAELSDGQRQRVLVARALAQQPAVLVLDEPTAFLDIAGRVELTLAIAELAREGLAVIASTHDLELALSHADNLWLVTGGAVRAGTPHELVADGGLTASFTDGNAEVDDVLAGILARALAHPRHVPFPRPGT